MGVFFVFFEIHPTEFSGLFEFFDVKFSIFHSLHPLLTLFSPKNAL